MNRIKTRPRLQMVVTPPINLDRCKCGGPAQMRIDPLFIGYPVNFPRYYVKCVRCGMKTKDGSMINAASKWNLMTKKEII